MMKATGRLLLSLLLFFVLNDLSAQAESARLIEPRPYKLLTSGKQMTFRSNKTIKQIMVWTAGGNRVAEHKDINASTYSIELPLSNKTFFLMVTFTDGKIFTEKIGIR